VSATAEQLYQEREKRVVDAIELRMPDRVPIMVGFQFFPARYAGVTARDLMYDPDRTRESFLKVVRDFEPDMVQNPFDRFLGPMLDAVDCIQAKWPGGNLPDHLPYQYIEQEYMKSEEYDALLSDPSDFIVRRLWPRIFGALKGLEKLPPLHNLYSYSVGMLFAFGAPEVAEALDALRRLSAESAGVIARAKAFSTELKAEGFPIEYGASTQAPFDLLADFFRGTKGVLLDLYRRPATVTAACDKFLPFLLDKAVAGAKASGIPRVFIPLHKGVDGAMSREQYLRFYWPTLRELLLGLIREGLCPCPFFEGEYRTRLDIIKDIPPGKACYKFESVDMAKARQVLGEGVCLRGGVPASLLVTGTPEAVKEHCRKLINVVATRGAFIMDSSSALDEAKPENVKALFDATREFGRYH
jgi:hypothetical protein